MTGPTALMPAAAFIAPAPLSTQAFTQASPLAAPAAGTAAGTGDGALGAGAWIAAVLVALATAVLLLPARRGLPHGRLPGAPSTATGAPALREMLGALRSRRTDVPEPDLALLLTEVASLLRAGATSRRAWTRALQRSGLSEGVEPDDDGVPPALHALADLQHDSWLPRWREGRLHWRPPPRGQRARQRRATPPRAPGATAPRRPPAAPGAPPARIPPARAGGGGRARPGLGPARRSV